MRYIVAFEQNSDQQLRHIRFPLPSSVAILAQHGTLGVRPIARTMAATREVHTLEDAFRWVEYTFTVLAGMDHDRQTIQEIAAAFATITISSAFSGIGAPELALMSIAGFLRRHVPGLADVRSTFFIERRAQSRLELMVGHACCCFGDMLDFLVPKIKDLMHEYGHRLPFDKLVEIFSRTAALKRTAWCYFHKKECEARRASIHVAGTPCVAWSPQGLQEGTSHSEVIAFLAWACQRLLLDEDAFLHENVPEFPESLLQYVFGARYIIQSIVVNSERYGHPNDRARRLSWCINKKVVLARCSPWPEFAPRFERQCHITWHEYFRAPSWMTKEEMEWACKRAKVDYDPDLSWEDVLSINERQHLRLYKDLISREIHIGRHLGAVAMLGQDPEKHRQDNHGKTYLQTLIKNCGIMFSTFHGRWLCPFETLIIQGFPVLPELQVYGESPSFCRSRDAVAHLCSARELPRKRGVIFEQAGNSMNTTVMGIGLLWWVTAMPGPGSTSPTSSSGDMSRLRKYYRLSLADSDVEEKPAAPGQSERPRPLRKRDRLESPEP